MLYDCGFFALCFSELPGEARCQCLTESRGEGNGGRELPQLSQRTGKQTPPGCDVSFRPALPRPQ